MTGGRSEDAASPGQLPDPSTTAIKRATAVTALGLLVQLASSFYWTPITFVLAAALGLPLVGVGVVMFLRAVLRLMKNKGAF
jgi:ABC-type nitrate/sulfonate/bicarbonate transport system permease component